MDLWLFNRQNIKIIILLNMQNVKYRIGTTRDRNCDLKSGFININKV